MRQYLTYWCCFLLYITSTPLLAQLQLAPVFSNNMVIQRNQPIHIWGKAPAGKNVRVSFHQFKINAKTKPDSTWSIYLPKQPTNTTPQTLTVSCENEQITLTNILLGDVWLCIGQSNMEWPMRNEMHFREELPHSNQPILRFLNPTYAGKNIYNAPFTDSVVKQLVPETFYQGNWESCDSLSFRNMSAVAYYFGKQIITSTAVPIGLFNLSIGGAPLETFIDLKALQNHSTFVAKTSGNWLINNALPIWIRERGQQNVGTLQHIPQDALGKNHAFKPGFAYSAGIEPLLPFPIKGILCYQGESNAQERERVTEYAYLTRLMVNDYRNKWKNPSLPYYFVQLSSIDTVRYKGQLWPEFRDVQRQLLDILPHSGMAVCTDIGAPHDVHPTNKKLVGERLARWALRHQYHLNNQESGPLPIKAVYQNGQITVHFKYIAKKLTTLDSTPLRGFSVDGIQDIQASTDGLRVYIQSPVKPEYLYYGWKPFSDANLCNSEKLPASTFKISIQ